MSRTYPVAAASRSTKLDEPQPEHATEIGIFTNRGYWHSTPASGIIRFAEGDMDLAENIAAAINQAYADGRRDAQRDLRTALGLEE